jgi:hypothetical protein
VSVYRSEVPTHKKWVLLLLKNFDFVLNFSIFASWHSKFTLSLLSAATVVAPYCEPKAALMQILFWRNNIENGNCPSPGFFAAPELEHPGLSLISYVKPIEKYLAPEWE